MQDQHTLIPEKARLLGLLRSARFNVPPFLYMPAEDFVRESFDGLEKFLAAHCPDYKVIVRSCHPQESRYKGGTFESLETYADLGGVLYARRRIIKIASTTKRLSILRQQKFNNSPELDADELGVIVMPFIEGTNVMAKMLGDHWEFGYCRDRVHRVQSEPYITQTPHDRKLLRISEDIQGRLGFPCEIEYVIGPDGTIHLVQATDISKLDAAEYKERERAVLLDGLMRIRLRRNYRERPIYLMDNQNLYLQVIGRCEDMVLSGGVTPEGVEEVKDMVGSFERKMERFALSHERFGVLGLSIEVPEELYQVANHYLDDTPELQAGLSRALYANLYKVDQFISEADTLVTMDRFRRNLCSHDAYGVSTVRNPLWTAFWRAERNAEVVAAFRQFGYTTGDYVGIEVDEQNQPTVFRL
ncbi:MAG: hypothetical protein K9K66_08495 [Desulfarculaceae bacterium]|nr:hypothetical protein [Desulfarculaceae bacterium]MCF8071359.1 hypothetical protein [Desulfarculaceae bacterium]MCF8101684.1 hypothetical protein [Desulfarculaceae bacterium]MCF8116707.1 hypothetical protein [Desulfarculaceae bacterium]